MCAQEKKELGSGRHQKSRDASSSAAAGCREKEGMDRLLVADVFSRANSKGSGKKNFSPRSAVKTKKRGHILLPHLGRPEGKGSTVLKQVISLTPGERKGESSTISLLSGTREKGGGGVFEGGKTLDIFR